MKRRANRTSRRDQHNQSERQGANDGGSPFDRREEVYRHSFNGIKIATPFTAIKLPAKSGTRLKDEIKILNEEANVESEQEETVEVGEAKYKAFPVKSIIEAKGQKIVSTMWYADGVGMVKQEMDFGGVSAKMKLVKFTAAKDKVIHDFGLTPPLAIRTIEPSNGMHGCFTNCRISQLALATAWLRFG